MKKCPTCEKTFDDNLRFCQSDGTPLVAAEEPSDPYKTTVANQADLPIPPIDPFKTMVAAPMPPIEAKSEVEEDPIVEEASALESAGDQVEASVEAPADEEVEFDMLKTMVATDFPPFERDSEPEIDEPVSTSEPELETPLSPFESASTPSAPVSPNMESEKETLIASPEPPKFSEPHINPPSFGEASLDAEPQVVTPAESESAPEHKTSPEPEVGAEPEVRAESEVVVEPEVSAEPEEPAVNLRENARPVDNKSNDFSADSPYGDLENVPIPSPFDASLPPGYQIPSAPMPTYKDADSSPSPAESPFANKVASGNQQIEAAGWGQTPTPNANWQAQPGGQNLPLHPSSGGNAGQNKTLVFVSIGLSVLGILILIPSLIFPICGIGSFLLGIGAIITGFLGRSRAVSQPEQFGGAGLGIAGIVLGVLSLLGPIAIVIFYAVILAGAGLINSR